MKVIAEYTQERKEFGGPDEGNPPPDVMWVYYEHDVPVMLDFLCPCGCGNTCPTHLVPPGEPHKERRWAFDANTTTITPSIRFLNGCKWHFNVTNGKVIVHADSGR